MQTKMKPTRWTALAALAAAIALGGCSSMSPRARDAAVGAAIGGVAGSVLTGGSAVGAVGGAVVGGVIGNENGKRK